MPYFRSGRAEASRNGAARSGVIWGIAMGRWVRVAANASAEEDAEAEP
jgi:hypothetical protein